MGIELRWADSEQVSKGLVYPYLIQSEQANGTLTVCQVWREVTNVQVSV